MLLALFACTPTVFGVRPPCVLDAPVADVAEAMPGDKVRLATRPMTEASDTAVFLGSTRVEIVAVSREGCDACDTCREDAECAVCDDCDDCAEDCATCEESVRIEVPELEPGEWPVMVTNRYGESGPGSLVVGSQN